MKDREFRFRVLMVANILVFALLIVIAWVGGPKKTWVILPLSILSLVLFSLALYASVGGGGGERE